MANPRQRRKSRSSSHKPVSHSRHAKRNLKKMPPIRAPKVLQEAWDPKKTVRQNYAALGLIHDLNPSAAGGAEIVDNEDQNEQAFGGSEDTLPSNVPANASSSSKSATLQNGIPKGYGRIIRNESGDIVRIELAEEEEHQQQDEDVEMTMEQLEPGLGEAVVEKWVEGMGQQKGRSKAPVKEGVMEELDKLSTLRPGTLTASLTGVGARFTSQFEREYLEKLVAKYGDDTEKMARDRKLNPEQRTEGELRRALRRAGAGDQQRV